MHSVLLGYPSVWRERRGGGGGGGVQEGGGGKETGMVWDGAACYN
jgi:hypothetical protein